MQWGRKKENAHVWPGRKEAKPLLLGLTGYLCRNPDGSAKLLQELMSGFGKSKYKVSTWKGNGVSICQQQTTENESKKFLYNSLQNRKDMRPLP